MKDPLQKPDPIGSEIAIKAGVDASGLTIKAKSRASSALDRLVGAALDIPGVWFERRAERARIIAVTEQEVMKIDAQKFLDQRIGVNSVVVSDSTWLKETLRRIENKSEVTSYAIEDLRNADVSQDKNGSDEICTVDNEQDVYKEDFEDWMNAFVHRAEMASSESIRELLGKILAGKILKPSSFSIATLRIVSELDRNAAENFQALCQRRFLVRNIAKPEDDEMRGKQLLDLYDLEDRGLIKEVGGAVGHMLTRQSDGFCYIKSGTRLLKIKTSHNALPFNLSGQVQIILLTSSGMQLAELLPLDHDLALRSIAKQMMKHAEVQYLEIFDIIGAAPSPQEGFKIQSIDIIKNSM